MIDRNTVFSYTTKLDRLSFIAKEKRCLKNSWSRTSFGIDPAFLESKEKTAVDLIHLKDLDTITTLSCKSKG